MSTTAETLQDHAKQIRLDVLEMVHSAGSGHIDSSLSVVEILTVLYFDVMTIRPDDPSWLQRDRLVLSKGHAAPALYACLARRGFFPVSDLLTLRRIDSHLQGHPKPPTPGVDVPSGSLGQGLSIAAGAACVAGRYGAAAGWRSFAVLSDGELDEGQTWEAIAFAGHHRLAQLTAIVDLNGLQYSGPTREVLCIEDLPGALTAMGWSCSNVDGHDCAELRDVLRLPMVRPHAVLARTIKGRGVGFMENDVQWHGKVPNDDDYRAARAELLRGNASMLRRLPE